jgi:hypothetical protein
MKKFMLFFFGFSWAFLSFAQIPKDTIFLANGSKIIGEIKKIKLGVITFDPDDANDITVQLQKLRTLAALSQLFRIETINNRVYFGQILPDSSHNHILIISGKDSILIRAVEISVLYPFKNSFKQRFSGNVGIGYNYTKSSKFGRLNFDGKLNYFSRKNELTLSTSGIYSITDSTFNRDREDISLKNNFYFSPTWFTTLELKYQRNLELGLERRYQEGLGAGNKFITTQHVYAWSRVGLVLNQEKSTENISSGTLAEMYAQLEFNFFRFTKPEINFVMAQTFYYSLSQSGRIRNDGETDLNWEIIKDFRMTITFYNNYDSKPPTATSDKFDFGIVFGLSLKF